MLGKGACEQIGKLLPLVIPNDDEPPGRDLPMVGTAHGDGQDSLKVLRRGSRFNQISRLGGPARFEEGEGRGSVNESHAKRLTAQPVGNNRLHKCVFAVRVPPKSNRPRQDGQ
jgi:hypothetical protein